MSLLLGIASGQLGSAAPGAAWTTTFSTAIASDDDDAEEAVGSGEMSLDGNILEMCFDGGFFEDETRLGVRFTGVTIPQAATIRSAHVTFTADVDQVGGAGSPTIDIHGQDADNPGTFTTTTGDISSRSLTTATVAWSPPSWDVDGESGEDQRTPDLATIVQEIVNRAGWSSGNAMAFVLSSQESDVDNLRSAKSHRNVAGGTSIEIVYEGGSDGGDGGGEVLQWGSGAVLTTPSDWGSGQTYTTPGDWGSEEGVVTG